MARHDRAKWFGWGIAIAITALAAPAAAPPANAWGERCEYVEAGPPGPRGNALVFKGAWSPVLLRRGEEIVVDEAQGLRCTGPQPTVRNVDRIVIDPEGGTVTVDLRGGFLGPGATPERHGSEVEIFLRGAEELWVSGGRGRNSISLQTLAGGDHAVNLDVGADGSHPDPDVMVESDDFRVFRINAEQGADRIDARRLTGIGDNEYLRSRVKLFGGAGDDVLLGGPGQEVLLDGPGDDLVRAGGGGDEVLFGPGRDIVSGGGGDDWISFLLRIGARRPYPDLADRVFGGPGNDTISDENGEKDEISCGPGRDLLDGKDRDRSPDCEWIYRGSGHH